MARFPDEMVERIKREISVQRLVEARGRYGPFPVRHDVVGRIRRPTPDKRCAEQGTETVTAMWLRRLWSGLLISAYAVACSVSAQRMLPQARDDAPRAIQAGSGRPTFPTVHDARAKREAAKPGDVPIAPEGPMPLMIAGAWEGSDPIRGKGALIGIFMEIDAVSVVHLNHGAVVATISAKIRLPEGFCFYQRAAGIEQRVWFETGQVLPDESSSWDGHRLQARLKSANAPSGSFAHTGIALDLTFNQAQQVWTGDYTRDGVTKRLRLKRPGVGSHKKPSPFVGTWSFPTPPPGLSPAAGCVSIVQGADGVFMAWGDGMGIQRVGPERPLSTAAVEDYAGQRWGIIVSGETVTLNQATYMSGVAGGLPERFIGKLSADGEQMVGKLTRPLYNLSRVPSQGRLIVLSKISKPCVSLLSVVLPTTRPCH